LQLDDSGHLIPGLFSRRLIEPEWLDHASPEEARPNLDDLIRINRYWGGHSVLRKVMGRVAEKGERFTLLDIGAASGDSARVINELFPEATVTNLDRNAVNLAGAAQPKLIADAFKLPFLERSFDYVLCTLFLHHFPDEEVITLLNSFYGLARKALVVCDLERHILPYCFLPATAAFLNWQRITLHDGPISVRASFRAGELSQLAKLAGIKNPVVEVHRPAFRVSLLGLKGDLQAMRSKES